LTKVRPLNRTGL